MKETHFRNKFGPQSYAFTPEKYNAETVLQTIFTFFSMKNKGRWILLGFLLVVFGITALVLELVGTQWVFLSFLEKPGPLFAFVAKIAMVIAGFLIVVLAHTDWDEERRDSR